MGGRTVYKFTQRSKSSSEAQFYQHTQLLRCHLKKQDREQERNILKYVKTKNQQQCKNVHRRSTCLQIPGLKLKPIKKKKHICMLISTMSSHKHTHTHISTWPHYQLLHFYQQQQQLCYAILTCAKVTLNLHSFQRIFNPYITQKVDYRLIKGWCACIYIILYKQSHLKAAQHNHNPLLLAPTQVYQSSMFVPCTYTLHLAAAHQQLKSLHTPHF